MPAVLIARVAGEDLVDIWEYVADESVAAADRLLDRIGAAFHRLAENPLSGSPKPELGKGLRALAVGNYMVFYRPIDRGIEVIRVLHGARAIGELF